jgi:phage-related protein
MVKVVNTFDPLPFFVPTETGVFGVKGAGLENAANLDSSPR